MAGAASALGITAVMASPSAQNAAAPTTSMTTKRSSRSSRKTTSRRSRPVKRRYGDELPFGAGLAHVVNLGPPGAWNVYVRQWGELQAKLRRLIATSSRRSADVEAETFMAKNSPPSSFGAGWLVGGVEVLVTSKAKGDNLSTYDTNGCPPGAVEGWKWMRRSRMWWPMSEAELRRR
jgi:hypothetical protein